MDKTPENHDDLEAGLIEAARNTARALGLTFHVIERGARLGPQRADALVRVGLNGQEALYAVEVKKVVYPAALGQVLLRMGQLGQQGLLVADYIAPSMADALKERGVAFIDAAGNAYLNQPNLLIWVTGRKPTKRRLDPKTGRAFQPKGLKVVFVLLCHPEWINHTYRDLATLAGVAHGTVEWVLNDLQHQGFMADLAGQRGARRLFNQTKLLAQWVDAYARTLRPKMLLGRYYAPTLDGWQDWRIDEHGAQWGGEPAGAILTEYLRPGELTLYAEKQPGMLAARHRLVKEPRPGHTAVVEVRERFWNFPAHPDRPLVVPPVLVYADLLATGDGRCIDTAKRVYEQYIDQPLNQA